MIGQNTVDVKYGIQKKELSLFIMAGKERPPLLGCNWLYSIKLDWAELHHVQKGSSADIVNEFPTVSQKNVGTIRGYNAIMPIFDSKKGQANIQEESSCGLCTATNFRSGTEQNAKRQLKAS